MIRIGQKVKSLVFRRMYNPNTFIEIESINVGDVGTFCDAAFRYKKYDDGKEMRWLAAVIDFGGEHRKIVLTADHLEDVEVLGDVESGIVV